MNILFTILLIGCSLSMDAFSLSLLYGTYSLRTNDNILLSCIVGIFHFFMPLLGLVFGNLISKYFLFNMNLGVAVIFFIIGIEMIISSLKKEEVNILFGYIGFLLFGLSVSIDSFTTGIGLSMISNNYILCSIIFMFISSFFTYIGLVLGKKLNCKFGNVATLIGGVVMLIMSVKYFVWI